MPEDLLKLKTVPVVERREVVKGRYEYIKGITNHPKTVEIFDRQTGETSVFTFTYKARRKFGINPRWIKDGRDLEGMLYD